MGSVAAKSRLLASGTNPRNDVRQSKRDRFRDAARFIPPMALFGAVKLVGFTVFIWLLESSGKFRSTDPRFGGGSHPWDVLGSWDGWWYRQVAQFGYNPQLIPEQGFFPVKQNSAAFFPLYPGLIRLLSDITGIGLFGAGITVSVIASFAAAAGIFATISRVAGPKAGTLSAGLWGVFPGSGVEWAIYTESLFVALAAWACYFVICRNWPSASLISFLAGLTRPSSATLIAAVAVAALVTLYRREGGIFGPLSAIIVPPTGLLGYIGWVGMKMGQLDGYITLQRGGWLHFFDYGSYTFQAVTSMLCGENNYLFAYPTEDLIALLVLFALPCLIVPMASSRPPLVLSLYTLGTLIVILGSQQMFGTLSRFTIPIFPLLIPLAVALSRVSRRSQATILGIAAVTSGWFAGYVIFELGIP